MSVHFFETYEEAAETFFQMTSVENPTDGMTIDGWTFESGVEVGDEEMYAVYEGPRASMISYTAGLQ